LKSEQRGKKLKKKGENSKSSTPQKEGGRTPQSLMTFSIGGEKERRTMQVQAGGEPPQPPPWKSLEKTLPTGLDRKGVKEVNRMARFA